MNDILKQCLWQREHLGKALGEVARRAGLYSHAGVMPESVRGNADTLDIGARLDLVSSQLGLEADPLNITYGDAEQDLQTAAPALVEYADSEQHGFFVLLRRSWRKIILLKPDRSTHRISPRELMGMLSIEHQESSRREIENLLSSAGISPARRAGTLDVLLKEKLKNQFIGRSWRLRPNPGSDFWLQIRGAGVLPLLMGFFVSHAVTYLVYLFFWRVLGQAVFAETLSRPTLWLLTGLILGLALLRIIPPWLYGTLSIRVGERLKRRLLYGTLRLEPEEIRHQGTGQFLGRVIETEAIETSAMRGSGNIFMGLIQMVIIVPYLLFGAGGWPSVLALCVWLVFTAGVVWRYFRARIDWTHTRMNLTHDLVEQMLGYRTRLAQQPRAEWHLQEEQVLTEYATLSRVMDRRNAWLKAAVPRGWILSGLLVLVRTLMADSTTPAGIALGISGIFFTFLSFQLMTEGVIQFSDAWVAWDQVKLMFDAAARPLQLAEAEITNVTNPNESPVLLAVEDLQFRYGSRTELILNDCNFSISAGDRILLMGSSGSGKSTLAAVLSGLRKPQKGKLTLDGVTRKIVGERAWRKRIVAAPQFHENHIFTETFAFNLLMGRCWPPAAQDLKDAEKICGVLGLNDLLERMPGGIFQIVGETGWQLSHGEKSRVYIARAILQGADMIILDESFSALDAGNVRRSLECVVEHAPTLVVIAHP